MDTQLSGMSGKGRCAITGTTGYLGSRLAKSLDQRGWTVYRLTRNPTAGDSRQARFSLDDGIATGFFTEQNIDSIVHCAYDFRLTKRNDIWQHNVQGSVRLLRQASAEGVRNLIFISTMSAFDGCASLYGQAKREIEKQVEQLGAIVVRPGLIYGDQPGSMVGALTKAVRALPVVPLIGTGRQVLYTTHEDDLAALVDKLLSETPPITGAVTAASEQGLTFRDILQSIADRNQKRVRFVPVPWRLMWSPLRIAELLGLKLGFRSDSIVSLVNQDPSPSFEQTRKIGICFRDFSDRQQAGEAEPPVKSLLAS